MSRKEQNKRYYQRKKTKIYNKYVYCLDIETSTATGTNKAGERVKCAYIISYAISKLDITTGEIIHDSFKRTYEQLNNDILRIQKESDGKPTLIFCHNFSYEWSFFKDNVSFFRENIKRQLFMSANKPLVIDCNNLSFRCSYLLFGKSVKTMGEELTALTGENWRKLDFEYTKIRTPLSEIAPDEIAYNYKDCDIVLKYFYEKMLSKYNIDDIFKKIFTKTGVVRFDNKKYNSANDYRRFIYFNRDCIPHTREQFAIEQLGFMGGLVSCNFKYIGKTLHNVASFDIASSYPYQMLKLYPTNFIQRTDLKDLKAFEQFRQNDYYNKHDFFYGIFEIANISLNDLDYPILSNHKLFESVDSDCIFGKVITAKRGVLICTSLDYENYKKFYKFDLVGIRDIYVNRYINYLPPYTIKSIARLLTAKTEMKKYNNEVIKRNELYNNYEFSDNFKYLSDILNTINDYQIQKAVAGQTYLTIKSDLNAMYGILVEKSLKSVVEYDFESHKYTKTMDDFSDFKNKECVKTNMLVGMFITAYARTQLITILHILLSNGINVYYTDTDSLKVDYTNPTKVNYLIDTFNASIEQTPYNIGQFEFEGQYNNFCVNGNKAYISEKHDVITATIAGLPHASIIYQSLYDNYERDFDKMIQNSFTFNIEIMPNVTSKLTSKYPINPTDILNLEFDTQLIHLKINDYDDFVYTGLILDDCPVTIKGIDTSLSNLHSVINLHQYYGFSLKNCIDKKIIVRDKHDNIIIKNNGKVSKRIMEVLNKYEKI